jgi:hypothetical protein
MKKVTFSKLAATAIPAILAAAVLSAAVDTGAAVDEAALRKALTFHASFDGTVDAGYAIGDPKLYWAPSLKQRQEARPGLPDGGGVVAARGAGRFGDALHFTKKGSPIVFFQGARNMPFEQANWTGTVSFWLKVDPRTDLEPGFCDPIQITPRAWNDAAFFVEFEKRPESIPFRLGVYADLHVWNPEKRRFADIPAHERPLVTVENPPFGRDKWTHIAFSFQNFNTGRPDGIVRLYLDGKPHGELSPRQQTFTWDPEKNAIALGLSYIGFLDELSIFNRALSGEEIATVYGLKAALAPLAR